MRRKFTRFCVRAHWHHRSDDYERHKWWLAWRTLPTVFLLMLLLAWPARAADGGADAGEPWDAVLVYRAVIDTRLADGGVGLRVVQVGGCWLNESACQGSAAELERRRGEKRYEDRHVDDLPQFKWLVGLAAVGFALGAASVVTLECTAHTCFGLKPLP